MLWIVLNVVVGTKMLVSAEIVALNLTLMSGTVVQAFAKQLEGEVS